jgi:hypothetical protein
MWPLEVPIERNETMPFTPEPPGYGMQPIALVSQLRRQVLQMHSIDEVFSWLSHTMVHQWHIPLVQFWAAQAYRTGQIRLELRTVASEDPSLPAAIHVNQQVVDVIQRLLQERRGVSPLPATNVFSPSQVEALAHYNLHYWAGYFIGNDLLLPPKKEAAGERISTPISMIISLFLQNLPSERLGRALDFTFRHSLLAATSQGFLTTSPARTSSDIPAESVSQHIQPTLATLIPHRSESIEAMRAGNPFANATILPDKNTRRLYSLVNGHRDVATLAHLADLQQKEMEEAIRLLLQQEKIELHDFKGNSIDASLVLKVHG